MKYQLSSDKFVNPTNEYLIIAFLARFIIAMRLITAMTKYKGILRKNTISSVSLYDKPSFDV